MTDLYNPIFTDVDAAREHLQSIRWPNGPICPHCGNIDKTTITELAGKASSLLFEPHVITLAVGVVSGGAKMSP